MKRILSRGQALWQDESGVTAIEYALLASLIAVAIMGAVLALGGTVKLMWDRVAGCVVDPSGCM